MNDSGFFALVSFEPEVSVTRNDSSAGRGTGLFLFTVAGRNIEKYF